MNLRLIALVPAILLLGACGDAPPPPTPMDGVPRWAQEAVWYQIFVERFDNGDYANDPALHDMRGSWPQMQPEGWEPTPWTHDWYAQEEWAAATGEDFYTTVQLRRYGGDFQGVMDRLDGLQELGVTAIYLNPVNDAPSLHKYDARNYRHMDRNFGPDPRGDEERIAGEDPVDPETWVWTASDSLFLELVHEIHERGMKVIVDFSWNHTGVTFWAWQDVLENGADSPYAGWYEIESFDDPDTPEDEFSYRGWAGVPELPELKKEGRPEGETHGPIPGTLVAPVREHVFNVTRRWMDPDGDGDPSDGVDGFRLDVAEMVPLDFWREYRRFVRGINPDAFLVGEVWWEEWPERMYDPAPWLQGDVFDAVMNYRWYAPTRSVFTPALPELTPGSYLAALEAAQAGIPDGMVKAQMNLTASHDTPRFGTSIYNPGRYKYQVGARDNPNYRLDRPGPETRRTRELILVQQFTWVGAPHIWYGDEVGMWGPDDPDTRKPMVWPGMDYDDEASDPFDRPRDPDPVEPDLALREVYQELIELRRANLELFVDGAVRQLAGDDETGVVAYERVLGGRSAVVVFNLSDAAQEITLPVTEGRYLLAHAVGDAPPGPVAVEAGGMALELPPRSARVWLRGEG